ncbi:hypothetical protein L9F63_009169, partial [Diploptera punctata]
LNLFCVIIELALWTHYVASEMKPELLDTIPGPTENGTSHHEQKNDEPDQSSDESTQDSTNGKHPAVAVTADTLDDTTTSFTEDSMDKPSTPTVVPPGDENTNDSIATSDSATNDSTAIVVCDKREVEALTKEETTSSLEEPPTKKTKVEDENKQDRFFTNTVQLQFRSLSPSSLASESSSEAGQFDDSPASPEEPATEELPKDNPASPEEPATEELPKDNPVSSASSSFSNEATIVQKEDLPSPQISSVPVPEELPTSALETTKQKKTFRPVRWEMEFRNSGEDKVAIVTHI